jgi:hypothetical protein
MEITYSLTADDYRYGFHAYRTRTNGARWRYRISLIIFLLCLADAVAFAILLPQQPTVPVLLLIFCIFLAYRRWYCPFEIGRKVIASSPSARPSRTVKITDAGFHDHTELSDSQAEWKTFVGWAENEQVFILLYSTIMFVPIPKRAMTEAQQQEVRALLKQHLTVS